MDAKCIKCENTNFSIVKREDELFCYVICSECGTIVGVLEDIDFKKHNNKVIRNHGFFDKRINEIEDQIKSIKKRNQEIFEMVEFISNTVVQISKKLK